MTLRVYWGSGSPVSWRVLLALAIKQVDYESKRLNLSEKEFRSEQYLALNPRGSFPLLVTSEEFCVRGSLAILNYLERIAPEHALFGESAEECAAIWQLIGDHDDHLGPATEQITRAYFRKNGDKSAEALAPSLETVGKELALLEVLVAEQWLVGTSMSAAECVLYPTMHRLLRANDKADASLLREVLGIELANFPALKSWLARMQEVPGVDETYPPHWR